MNFNIPDLGIIDDSSGFRILSATTDGRFISGKEGVKHILCTGDGKVEFVAFENQTLAYVNSVLGYGAYYPLHSVNRKGKIKAVLMDLDGTSVRSEEFWIWIIEKTTASMLDDESFKIEDSDIPFVSGHSVSEHLQYCIDKYCPGESLDKARNFYFEHVNHEMKEIMEGNQDALTKVLDMAPDLVNKFVGGSTGPIDAETMQTAEKMAGEMEEKK